MVILLLHFLFLYFELLPFVLETVCAALHTGSAGEERSEVEREGKVLLTFLKN